MRKPLKDLAKELAEPLLIKNKVKYISRGYFNEAIQKAIKIGFKTGIKYKNTKKEAWFNVLWLLL